MKISISFLAISAVMMLFVSCSKNNDCNCSEDIYGKWEVEEFMSVESVLYAKDNNYSPVIEFQTEGNLQISLDVNACFGEYQLSQNSAISITNAGCAEACCDSDFSEKIIEMLTQVTSYEINGDELKLEVSGWGWIVLERISD